MILGIGSDILAIAHFEKAVQASPRLIQRVFTVSEQELAPKNSVKKITYYAKRFAAKEAFSKACGTGIGSPLSWQDIEIKNTPQGAPYFILSDSAKEFVCQKFQVPTFTAHLSLSDDKDALAFVVLEK